MPGRAASIVLALLWVGAAILYWSVAPAGRDVPLALTFAGLLASYLLLWGGVFVGRHRARVELRQGFVLTTLSIALFVVACELLAVSRLVDFRVVFETPAWDPWSNPQNRLDPVLLHIHRPHQRFWWFGVHYVYDQHGLRNSSDLRRADIAVLGDSFIEGPWVSPRDLLTTRLAEQTGLTVANLAQSWYGPQQELELLRRFGLALRPSACVWAFVENDLEDFHRYVDATRDWPRFSKQLDSWWPRSFTRNALAAVQRLRDKLPGAVLPPDPLERGWGMFQADSGVVRLTFMNPGTYLSSKDEQALEGIGSILHEASHLCQARGATFLVIFIPTKFRVYHGVTTFTTDAEPRYWVVNDLPTRLATLLRQRAPGAAFLDLTPTLTEAAERGELVYFAYDTHWTIRGHRIAASAVAKALAHPTFSPETSSSAVCPSEWRGASGG